VADEPAESSKWWSGVKPSPEVNARLQEMALGRARVFMPIVLFAIVFALVISEPAGIPLTGVVLTINGINIVVALFAWWLLRRGRIDKKWAHAIGSIAWVLTPINTLVSVGLTDAPTLVLPLMIELAALALVIDTRWALAVSLPVVVFAFPLLAKAGNAGIYPTSVVGVWLVAMIMQVALRRSLIRSETNRIGLETALSQLRHELTERKRVEADKEALRDQFVHAQRMDAVGTLSAGLAHDMNNILGGILAFAEILRAEAKDPAVREDLDKIRQEAERGAALTRGLLAFSRRGAYRRRPIALGTVIEDMAPLLSRTLGKSIKLERSDGPLAIVSGDPAQLGQVLINLCLNAADAMDGRGHIWIATDIVTRGGKEHAKLSVTDTGKGMDEATKKRMFEPFFTTKPVGKGTGLGLAMVYGAVQSHGGEVEVESKVGAGTTIDVYLPVVDAAPETKSSHSSHPSVRFGPVLIVDDEAMMRPGAARIVEALGLATASAGDGEEALAVFEQNPDVVLVILDMAMPRMGGAACFKELRKRKPKLKILITSGYTDHTEAQSLLAAGANGFLEKPYTAEQLGLEIDRILQRSRRG
jgi:signal transduction histidine kinase